jgi:hypothetical protein
MLLLRKALTCSATQPSDWTLVSGCVGLRRNNGQNRWASERRVNDAELGAGYQVAIAREVALQLVLVCSTEHTVLWLGFSSFHT